MSLSKVIISFASCVIFFRTMAIWTVVHKEQLPIINVKLIVHSKSQIQLRSLVRRWFEAGRRPAASLNLAYHLAC